MTQQLIDKEVSITNHLTDQLDWVNQEDAVRIVKYLQEEFQLNEPNLIIELAELRDEDTGRTILTAVMYPKDDGGKTTKTFLWDSAFSVDGMEPEDLSNAIKLVQGLAMAWGAEFIMELDVREYGEEFFGLGPAGTGE